MNLSKHSLNIGNVRLAQPSCFQNTVLDPSNFLLEDISADLFAWINHNLPALTIPQHRSLVRLDVQIYLGFNGGSAP